MKDVTKMTYRELEDELRNNHIRMGIIGQETATRYELIRRDHDLMTEMDRRWNSMK